MSMIKIELLEVAGLASVMQALRLPYGKNVRSYIECDVQYSSSRKEFFNSAKVRADEKDVKLLETLVKNGDEHAKVLRGMVVYLAITAPIWFYRELETYRVGRERGFQVKVLCTLSAGVFRVRNLKGQRMKFLWGIFKGLSICILIRLCAGYTSREKTTGYLCGTTSVLLLRHYLLQKNLSYANEKRNSQKSS